MRVHAPSNAGILRELRELLASDQLPVQQEIARVAGVHQSLVSRAQNGQLKRRTPKVDMLLEYARSHAGAAAAAVAAAAALDQESGKLDPPDSSADDTGNEGKRRKAPPGSTAAEAYRRQARDGIETYLNEGYDPRLVVEQLAVLRRAQRVRRPGKPRANGAEASR